MSRKIALGGQRLGSGNKNDVELHGFERSNHDLSYIWRSSMAPGTLVPFLSVPMLPGDDFDIDLNTMVMTHPTIGPLFGSFKVQLDLFQVPIRLYMGILMQNRTKIGLNMGAVKLPTYTVNALYTQTSTPLADRDNQQINPSSIFKYLGVSGLGRTISGATGTVSRSYNAIAWLAYWDIYKQYYANKQEEVGYVIHNSLGQIIKTVTSIQGYNPGASTIVQAPAITPYLLGQTAYIRINYTGGVPKPEQIIFDTSRGNLPVTDIFETMTITGTYVQMSSIKIQTGGTLWINNWRYIDPSDVTDNQPQLTQFPLENIDEVISDCISHQALNSPFNLSQSTPAPFGIALEEGDGYYSKMNSQEGLAVKTYQSDLFNNWLNEEWIDGTGGVNEISSVSTTGDSFTIDALNLANKVYNLFNRIAVSDGTYKAYIEAAYDHDMYGLAAHPIYEGGLSKELEFQEVVSNAATGDGTQPLGTLAGRGVMGNKHKGGSASIRANEYSYAMGIISLTPRIDYTQGNAWDINLQSISDFHVPNLDGIGFQDLLEEYMHWQGTEINGGTIVQNSVGKVPAWINYMTAVNRAYGNFAIKGSEMFMILARNYETFDGISDVTTYIDPVKYNQIFAYTKRDAQNFWVQIRIGIKARRKMSAKVMPNM